jgi:hypothetical protein
MNDAKYIGLEAHQAISDRTMVGTSRPRCLLASDTAGVVAPERMNTHRGKNLRTSPPHLGWKPGRTLTQLPALGKVFVLTSPFMERRYRKVTCWDRTCSVRRQIGT